MSEPREYTDYEIRELFLLKVKQTVRYWADLPDMECADKVDGCAFSILTLIDGCTDLPAFSLIARPHPSDKQYHIEEDSNWFPDNVDISGFLHDEYCKLNFPA